MMSTFSSLLICAVAVLAVFCPSSSAAPRVLDDDSATCPQQPLLCLSAGQPNECELDSDCAAGGRCCYRGCVKQCSLPNPCSGVICQQGYVCTEKSTPCETKPCAVQAVCIPEVLVKCPSVNCDDCQAGYEQVKDANGCPTCECVWRKDCGPTCEMSCSNGFEEDEAGCPICQCKEEPETPCSDVTCGSGWECRLVQVTCVTAPCEPQPQCVPKTDSSVESSCSYNDRNTVGLPVLGQDMKTELDCYTSSCPDRTVCTTTGVDRYRCCLQSAQAEVVATMKAGECPQEYMINFAKLSIKCQLDGQCPGDQRCCYKRLNVAPELQYGYCMDPQHVVIANAQAECNRSFYLKVIFSMYGLC